MNGKVFFVLPSSTFKDLHDYIGPTWVIFKVSLLAPFSQFHLQLLLLFAMSFSIVRDFGNLYVNIFGGGRYSAYQLPKVFCFF